MADPKLSNAAALAMADALAALADEGATNAEATLLIYSGTAPANVDDAATGDLLAELVMSNPAFGAAADANPGATITAGAIATDTAANDTGTAGYFRILDRDEVAIFQGDVSGIGGGGNLQMNDPDITAGAGVAISSLTITMPES